MKNEFRVRRGTIIGSEHQRKQGNNQDGFATGEGEFKKEQYLWGVICDGCSAGSYSEVGAILLSQYLCEEVSYLLASGSVIEEIPDRLFIAGLGYLRSLASYTAMSGYQKQIRFIEHHLLCTVVGFIMNERDCIFFNAGDGMILVNNDVYHIKQDNKPLYMAYHLLEKSVLSIEKAIPFKFETRSFSVADLERFAVCSDGMEESAIEEIWGHEHLLGLQRRLRVLRLQKKALFSDDCTVITVEREVSDDGR